MRRSKRLPKGLNMPLENPSRWAAEATIEALDDFPCLRCVSDNQLILILAFLLCRVVSTDRDNECTAAEMVEDASCSGCFSRRQLTQYLVQMIARYAVDNALITDFDAIVQEVVCLNCADSKKLLGMVVDQVERGITNGTLFNPS